MANQKIMLGDREVSASSEPYFIAEIGINHNGDMQIAKRLIDASFAIGWDCVKFQKRTPSIAVPEAQKSVMRDTPCFFIRSRMADMLSRAYPRP